jgi:2-amino-4-hydroxy-6-hydroxymethyldihydropteridine diphosphokinase
MPACPPVDGLILIGLGANLTSSYGPPRTTLELALQELERRGIAVAAVSSWYESAPVPASDQPWFVNIVASIRTELEPEDLLALLHDVELAFGRVRLRRWEARVLDLDLLDYRGQVRLDRPPLLPHPSLAERSFVLLPLRDLAPRWRHPRSGETVEKLIDALPAGQQIRRMAADTDA